VLDDNIKAVDDATARVKQLMKHIERFVEGHALQPLVKALMSFRGIQILSATVIAAEIGDLRRFKTARQFMAFLGLVPSEQSSDAFHEQRQGSQQSDRGAGSRTGGLHLERWTGSAAAGLKSQM
jgi:transposase